MLQVITDEKREPLNLQSREFGGSRLTTQATVTSAWWILPNVALARMRLKSFIVDIGDPDYVFTDAVQERRPYFPNQKDVNDRIRDHGLTKTNAELLISRLKQRKLLDESVQVTDQIKRHQTFSSFFSRQDGLAFCNNLADLFEAIDITSNPSEWRLFIDSSSRSLTAVLLHNGNSYPSLPMAHSVHLKEDYAIIQMLLSALKYD